MALPNNPNDTETLPDRRPTRSTAPKKKIVKKTAKPVTARPAVKRTPKTPTEILFDQLPDPSQVPQPPYIWIDHPQNAETLFAPSYSVRMGVGGAEQVEMSVDKGPWQPCRATSGYWWFDWSGIATGKHTLVARMRTSGGLWYKTPPTSCRL